MKKLFYLIVISIAFAGCKAFYENTGSHTQVGEISTPLELSEPTSNFSIKALFEIVGCDVWCEKQSIINIVYKRTTKTEGFFLGDEEEIQEATVKITPAENTAPAEK